MLEFHYICLPGGISRPIIPFVIEGPRGRRLLDGLLDTGSDRTILPQREAKSIGIQLSDHADGIIRTAGGVSISYQLAEIVLELRASGAIVRWKTMVAFAWEPLNLVHLGTKGFLEYFHSTFLGPEGKIILEPCLSLLHS
jgi:hypothetical protein